MTSLISRKQLLRLPVKIGYFIMTILLLATIGEAAQQPPRETPATTSAHDLTSLTLTANPPPALYGNIFGFAAQDFKKDVAQDHQLLRLRSRLGMQHNSALTDLLRVQGRATMEWDLLDYDNRHADTDNHLNLHEAFVRLSGGAWDLSVGKQRVRWGKSDQLSPLDSINPDDLRQFITLDLEDRKIPSWLTQLRLHGSKFSIETIVSPWFEKSKHNYFDSDWALYRNLRQSIISNPRLPQTIKDYAANLRVNEKRPGNSLRNMSAGLRLTWQTDRSDFGISYRYGWETLPNITSFPVKNIRFNGDPGTDPAAFLESAALTDERVEARYKRQQVFGLEWETAFELIGFRGEVAYFDQASFLTSDLTSASKEVVHLVAGIDHATVNDWYFNLQTSWHRILNYHKEILYFEQDNISLLGEIRKTLWRGNLDLSTRYNYVITDGSSYLQPAVTLKYFSNTEIEVGSMIFSGDGDTLFGSYDGADQGYLLVRYAF